MATENIAPNLLNTPNWIGDGLAAWLSTEGGWGRDTFKTHFAVAKLCVQLCWAACAKACVYMRVFRVCVSVWVVCVLQCVKQRPCHFRRKSRKVVTCNATNNRNQTQEIKINKNLVASGGKGSGKERKANKFVT